MNVPETISPRRDLLLWKASSKACMCFTLILELINMNFKPKLVRKGDSESKVGTSSNYEPVTKYMTTDLITFTPETDIISRKNIIE